MKIALLELRRQPRRFGGAVAILTLLGALLMLLGGLLDGLTEGGTNAITAQRADLIVYSANSGAKFAQSRIDPATAAVVAGTDGVTDTGALNVVQLGARLPDSGPRDLVGVRLFGYEIPPAGVGAPPAAGEAYADVTLRDRGAQVGDVVLVGSQKSKVKIIGFVPDTTYVLEPTLWANVETWSSIVGANRPSEQLGVGVSQSLAVTVTGDPLAAASRIDAATGGTTTTLTPAGVVEADKGVQSQNATFGGIIGITVLIAIVVIALFFALLTAERTGLYGVLKALGARSGALFAGVVAQAVILTLIASLIATALALALEVALPPGVVPYSLSATRVISSVGSLLLAAVVGCAFSLRRVLRIDPASAIGGST